MDKMKTQKYTRKPTRNYVQENEKKNSRQTIFGQSSTFQKLYKKIGCTDLNETRVTNSMDNEDIISRVTSASVALDRFLVRRRTIVVMERARAGSQEWQRLLIPKSLHW